MKDKIYKLNRPKGFYIFKRCLIALTSVFICSVVVAVPLSILIYTQTSPVVEKEEIKKNSIDHEEENEETETNNELVELN